MGYITFLGFAGYAIRFIYTMPSLVFLWWRKEYRLDRMRIHLNTKQGENVLLGKTHLVLLASVVLGMVPVLSRFIEYLLAGFFAVLAITYLRSLRSWLWPPVSPKVITLCAALTFFVFCMVMFVRLPMLTTLAIADLLLFPVSLLLVYGMSAPTRMYHAVQIRKAIGNLRAHAPMNVIGITGSYGKTSVKEYLSAILASSYPTLKTEASKNSPIGIAEVVLRSLEYVHKAFVVEMGAYRPGEIAEMCRMVRPEVGILTAINPQHQDLFGSLETTMKAKYELLSHLTGRKIAIVNLDDERVMTLAAQAVKDGCEVWCWTSRTLKRTMPGIDKANIFRAEHITSDLNGVSFDCVYQNKRIHIHAPVIGVHQAGNITAAVAGAVAMGMTFPDAAKAAGQVMPAHKVMHVTSGIHGSVFIDDTFNNNPDAAAAAIQFLGLHKGKKILVFQPMVELGSYAESSHTRVGELAAKYCDAVLLTNSSHFEAFEKGVRSVSSSMPLFVYTPIQISEYIRTHVKKHDVVLFKGKDAEHALHLLV